MLRAIDRFVDLGDLRARLAPFYRSTGRPSIDPELLIRMLLVGYCYGIRPGAPMYCGVARRSRDCQRRGMAPDGRHIRVISRDRGGGYGDAAARALSDALQVADRWHLMENWSQTFIDAVRKSMCAIREALGASEMDPALLTLCRVAPIGRLSATPRSGCCAQSFGGGAFQRQKCGRDENGRDW
jgi:hypothetical protein